MKRFMTKYKPWLPRMRSAPLFHSFRPSTDWTRALGANDRIEIAVVNLELGADYGTEECEEQKEAA